MSSVSSLDGYKINGTTLLLPGPSFAIPGMSELAHTLELAPFPLRLDGWRTFFPYACEARPRHTG